MQLSCLLPLAGGLALGLVAGGLVTFLLLSPAPTSLGNTDPGPPDHRDTARWGAVQSEEDTMPTIFALPGTLATSCTAPTGPPWPRCPPGRPSPGV